MSRKLTIKVKPNSRQQKLETGPDGNVIAWLKSPPVDGKANAELIALLAKAHGVAKSHVRICSGLSGRLKRVEILNETVSPSIAGYAV